TPVMVFSQLAGSRSDRIRPGFTGADTDDFLDVGDEDLAVADPPGLGSVANGLDGRIDHIVDDDHLDFDLRQEVDHILRTAIEFRVAFLATETLRFDDGDALKPDFLKSFLHFIELERFNDRFDLFHSSAASDCLKAGVCPLRRYVCRNSANW